LETVKVARLLILIYALMLVSRSPVGRAIMLWSVLGGQGAWVLGRCFSWVDKEMAFGGYIGYTLW